MTTTNNRLRGLNVVQQTFSEHAVTVKDSTGSP